MSSHQWEFNREDQETWHYIRQAVRRVGVSCIYHNEVSGEEKRAIRRIGEQVPSSPEMSHLLQHPLFA